MKMTKVDKEDTKLIELENVFNECLTIDEKTIKFDKILSRVYLISLCVYIICILVSYYLSVIDIFSDLTHISIIMILLMLYMVYLMFLPRIVAYFMRI